ncbi:MAG TPA: PAS domain S-box protein [Anaeromyxobacteraceae bacterium]|nr:PAS domain S-box protein [Anaeromyxobacteraceae bacterium]
MVGVLTAISFFFIYNDLVFARHSPVLPLLFAVRAVYTASGVAVVVLGLRARSRDALDLSILLNLAAGALFTVAIQSTRPADYYLPALQNVIGTLLAWAVIPNRFWYQALGGGIVTGACVAWIATFRVPPPVPAVLLLALSLVTANLGGAFISWRLHRSRRLQYLAERDQREALRRTAESEELFRTAFENAPIGKALTGPDGRIVRVNGAFARFLGYEPPELVGKDVAEVTAPEDLASTRAAGAEAAAGRTSLRMEKRYRRKDGATAWGDLTSSVVRNPDGSVRLFVSDVVDLDERRRAEAALASSQSRYTELYDGLGDGVCSVTLDGALLDFNEAYRRMLGYGAEELRGLRYQDLTPERWHADEARRVAELLRDPRGVITYEKEYRRKDGTVFPVELRVRARRQGDEVGGLWVLVRDITREKALRDQLAVTSRLATLGTLVAGVAHEINNPLGGAMASHGYAAEEVGALAAALRSGAPLDREAVATVASKVQDALADALAGERRIAAIVKDLTLLGSGGARRGLVAPRRAAEECMDWIPAAIRAQGKVSVEDLGAPDVLASEGQLVQVLVNLVSNALRAAPAGRHVGVRVRVGPGAPGKVRIEVSDDGVGMPPEVQARMFDPFFTTRGAGQGMGLGLAICHAIVAAHGGEISATSAVGAGTTVRVELPVAA